MHYFKSFIAILALYLTLSNSMLVVAQQCNHLPIRKSITTYSQTQMDSLTNAILAMKNRVSQFNPSFNAYDYFVNLHYDASAEHFSNAHHSPGFLVWHREFLLRFEQELRVSTNNPSYTLPYWDWVNNTAFTKVFSPNAFGGNGLPTDDYIVQNGRFGKGSGQFKVNIYPISIPDSIPSIYIKRHFSWLPTINTLPDMQDINRMMSKTVYDTAPWDYYSDTAVSFRNYLEGYWNGPNTNPTLAQVGDGLHGRVHLFIGGNMVSNSSPNDPVFFLHHCNVDRLFAQWQDVHGVQNFPSEWLLTHYDAVHGHIDSNYYTPSDLLFGFDRSFADLLSMRDNCYRYDTQSDCAPFIVVTGQQAVDAGATTTYSIAPSSGSTYAWTVTGGAIVSGQGTPQISVLWGNGAVGQCAVLKTDGSCASKGQLGIAISSVSGTIAAPFEENTIVIYPNPVVDHLLHFSLKNNENDLKIAIFDILGRQALERSFSAFEYENEIELNISNLHGLYWVKVGHTIKMIFVEGQ
jgi:tyrosinase